MGRRHINSAQKMQKKQQKKVYYFCTMYLHRHSTAPMRIGRAWGCSSTGGPRKQPLSTGGGHQTNPASSSMFTLVVEVC